MADVNTMKDRVIDKLESIDLIQVVYPTNKVNPSGFPCVFVTTSNLEGSFASSAENLRIYAFNIIIAFSIGHDLVPETEQERLDYSERVLNDVLDATITAFDEDISLGDSPIIFVEAADCEWGWMDFESGEAQALSVVLKIHSEKVVV